MGFVAVSSHWYTCLPGWGDHILFVGMLRLQENLRLENYNRVAEAKLRTVRLRKL